MKRLLIALLLLAPLTASSAIQQYRMEWNPLPSDQTISGECAINGQAYQPIGSAAGNSNITFSLDVTPGDSIQCRAWATKTGFEDSPRSEVAAVVVPLQAPQGVRVQAVSSSD